MEVLGKPLLTNVRTLDGHKLGRAQTRSRFITSSFGGLFWEGSVWEVLVEFQEQPVLPQKRCMALQIAGRTESGGSEDSNLNLR